MVDPTSPGAPRFYFTERRTFYVKVAILAITTVALIPVLLLKNTDWAAIYLVALTLVHLAGIVVVVVGVKRAQIAPDTRGLVIRVVAIVLLVALIYLASLGVRSGTLDVVFWASLFAIWALHTAGLALLHIRGRREASVCPFV